MTASDFTCSAADTTTCGDVCHSSSFNLESQRSCRSVVSICWCGVWSAQDSLHHTAQSCFIARNGLSRQDSFAGDAYIVLCTRASPPAAAHFSLNSVRKLLFAFTLTACFRPLQAMQSVCRSALASSAGKAHVKKACTAMAQLQVRCASCSQLQARKARHKQVKPRPRVRTAGGCSVEFERVMLSSLFEIPGDATKARSKLRQCALELRAPCPLLARHACLPCRSVTVSPRQTSHASSRRSSSWRALKAWCRWLKVLCTGRHRSAQSIPLSRRRAHQWRTATALHRACQRCVMRCTAKWSTRTGSQM